MTAVTQTTVATSNSRRYARNQTVTILAGTSTNQYDHSIAPHSTSQEAR